MMNVIINNRIEQLTPGVSDKSVTLAAKPRILFSPAAAGGWWLLLPPHGDIKSALPLVPGGPQYNTLGCPARGNLKPLLASAGF